MNTKPNLSNVGPYTWVTSSDASLAAILLANVGDMAIAAVVLEMREWILKAHLN